LTVIREEVGQVCPSVRHTALERLVQHEADAGASGREIMAWTGHKTTQMVQVYTRKARRDLMADIGFEKLMQNEQDSKVDEPNKKGSAK